MTLPPIKAMGTIWHIELFEVYPSEAKLYTFIVDWLEEFESRYSRFRPNSWLSTLNRRGEFENPDPQFVDVLKQSLDYYVYTKGLFNIAIGEKLVNAGYDSTYSFTATQQNTFVPPLPDVLLITEHKITLTSGQLDLGGIGKGYAIDALAETLRKEFNLAYFLINGGGDIYVTSDYGNPITIKLAHPYDKSLSIGSVQMQNSGFAASSPHVRSWFDAKTGIATNHLLTTHERSAYVTAKSAVEADVWATTLCLSNTIYEPNHIRTLIVEQTKILHCNDVFKLNTMH